MRPTRPAVLLRWLRAAGEPSRLRLLALCADAALSVSDLAQALGQSEPRVSRHLKILCDAGLAERLRQGQWVHYRITGDADAASFVRGLLGQLDRRDPQLLRDASSARSAATSATDGAGFGAESRLGRALAGFVAASGLRAPLGTALVVGVSHPELLECAAAAARQCEALARVLEDARRVVAPTGRLWIFERYESLEGSRERIVEHPLARLRRLLGTAGLVCERLSPLEADGEHVLAAVAHAAAGERGEAASAGRVRR